MKSLLPINEETNTVLMAQDQLQEYQAKIDELQSQINVLQSKISSITSEVQASSISKGTVSASRFQGGRIVGESMRISGDVNLQHNATISGTVTTDKVSASDNVMAPHIAATSEITSPTVSVSGTVSGNRGEFNRVVGTTGRINTLDSTLVRSNTVSADVGTFNTLNIDQLNIATLDTLNSITSSNGLFNDVQTEKLLSKEAETELENVVKSRITTLYNQTKQFCDDETDSNQFVTLDTGHQGSNVSDYRIIKIPSFTSGWYRIELKQRIEGSTENATLFSVNFFNTEHCPIVQYSKDNSGDITDFYYDLLTNTFYVKTYAAGQIYWASDTKDAFYAPEIQAELDCDPDEYTTLHYSASANQRLVIMGDHSPSFGVSVQGALEADIVKKGSERIELFYYGNTWRTLSDLAKKYLVYESDGVKHYTTVELAGYLYHTDDNYRDADGTETEALEKISYDGTNITLTVDSKYGQDDIILNDEYDFVLRETITPNNIQLYDWIKSGDEYIEVTDINTDDPDITVINGITFGNDEEIPVYDRESMNETLPFILSFTIATYAWDLSVNQDNFNREM